jgi:ferredoxin
MLDLPVDYDELARIGSMMGSGGMIVMDEDTCMVDVARYFLNFLKGESCGKCVACREGIRRMLQILERITGGQGREEDLGTLREIGEYLQETALCALGTTAANPILTTLKYFQDEFETHIRERHCPAGVCKNLFRYVVAAECNGCGLCRKRCPVEAVSGKPKEPHVIDQQKCIKCGACFEACRYAAIAKARVEQVVA